MTEINPKGCLAVNCKYFVMRLTEVESRVSDPYALQGIIKVFVSKDGGKSRRNST
jgi:hypothetical protein